MSLKCLIFAAALAVAQAGYIAPVAYGGLASTAIGSSSQSTLRSLDGGSAISHYSKAVDTAYSSVRKSDTRITNDQRYLSPVAYHAPAYAAAPVVARAYAPAAYAPAAYAPAAYAPAAYAPALARSYAPAYAAAPAVAAHGLLGVAYSAAPTVAHVSYDSPIVHYAL